MTPEQIYIINTSISNLSLLCKSYACCKDCPMYENCMTFPWKWELVKEGDKSGK